MLEVVAISNLALSAVLACWAALDVNRRPPPMAVMKWVWPLTFLWGGLFALVLYLWFGRAPLPDGAAGHDHMQHGQRPMWQSVVLGATHCGAGCSLADLLVEGGTPLLGVQLVVAGQRVFGTWIVDYVVALATGVIFQYAAQAPMSDAPRSRVWWQSFRSDVLSLTFWQIGMYGWMGLCIFVLFDPATMESDHWVFWLMMQVAMLCGFVTALPVNWLLIRAGVKEAM